MFFGFFGLKLTKSGTFETTNEEYFVRLITCSSVFLYNQSKLTTFANFFIKRVVHFLLRCNLLLFREQLFLYYCYL